VDIKGKHEAEPIGIVVASVEAPLLPFHPTTSCKEPLKVADALDFGIATTKLHFGKHCLQKGNAMPVVGDTNGN
jgi:hypothetical protein